ncbi:Orn/Arg/Lys decarboxylase [Pseudomonas aeruginosa]|nr:Orn/Arg/Lys decarboxylase [Pseudomonas aeruginosa]
MYKDLKFPVLIVHRDIKADTVAGERVRGIAHELEQDGFSILSTASSAEGRIVASTHHGLACILVAAEGAGENQRLLQDVVELIRVARVRAPQLPIFALGEQVTIENAPAESMADLHQLRGILYLFEDTVPFLARQVARGGAQLPGRAAAAILPCAGRAHRAVQLFLAYAGPRRRCRLSQESGGTGVPPVLRGEHAAFRPVGSRSPSWDRCSTIPAPWPRPRTVPRAISAPTIPSS